jgi:hypothetical protein
MAVNLDKLEQETAPLIDRTLTGLMRHMLRQYEAEDIVALPTDARERVIEMLADVYGVSMREAGQPVIDGLKDCFPQLETKQDEDDLFQRLIEQFIEQYGGAKVQQILETTRKQINAVIREGQREGLGVEAIAKMMREAIPEFSRIRSRVIARTETHGSSQFAQYRTAQQSTRPLVKQWNSVIDTRTRAFIEDDKFDHRVMDGERVALEQPFMVPTIFGTKEPLMFCGDPNGSAGNIINCRCAMTFKRADRGETSPAAQAAVAGRPVNRFAYQSFVAPKSVAEMEDFLTNNSIAGRASLRAMSPKKLASQLVYFQEATERFDLDPIIAVGPATRFGLKGIKGANAAIYRVTETSTGRKAVFHLPTNFTSDLNYNQQKQAAIKKAGIYEAEQRQKLQSGANIPDEVKSIASVMESRGDKYNWTFNATMEPEEARRHVIYHEYGHVLHLSNAKNPQMQDDINDFLSRETPIQKGWDLLISKYSSANDKEYVAEAFSLYMSGEKHHYRIHPRLLGVFKRYDRAVNDT